MKIKAISWRILLGDDKVLGSNLTGFDGEGRELKEDQIQPLTDAISNLIKFSLEEQVKEEILQKEIRKITESKKEKIPADEPDSKVETKNEELGEKGKKGQ